MCDVTAGNVRVRFAPDLLNLSSILARKPPKEHQDERYRPARMAFAITRVDRTLYTPTHSADSHFFGAIRQSTLLS